MRFIINNVQTTPNSANFDEFEQFRDLALNVLANSEFFWEDDDETLTMPAPKAAPKAAPKVAAIQQPSRLAPPLLELFATLCIT
jgi:hypothetical protein